MSNKRGHVAKTSLTPIEKLKVAYCHEIKGVAQHVLADIFDVNPGRVAEAITEVRHALKIKEGADGKT